MERSKLADLSEIFSSIAILITLVYLTVEISQNTDALQAESRQALLAGGQAELLVQLDHPEVIISISKPEPLTQEEHVKLNGWLFAVMRSREFAWLQYNDGIIDDAQWGTEKSVIHFILDSQRTRDWWTKVGRTAFSSEFTDFVDSLIQDRPPSEVAFKAVTNYTTQ